MLEIIMNKEKLIFSKKMETIWNQSQILIANDGEENDYFGTKQGKAYIFQKNGTIWNQSQILIANDDGNKMIIFGTSVSISNDSNILLIGAFGRKVYIFQNNGNQWNQIQILTSSDGQEYDNFGSSVSISSDSSLILIGAYQADVEDHRSQGKAYIFQKNGNQWYQIQILTSSDGKAGDQFGTSVSISEDTSLILIGSFNAYVDWNNTQGKAYIFQKNGTYWNQIQILISSYEQFESWQMLKNDNKEKLIFSKNEKTIWNQFQILIASDGEANDYFGSSVSISNDGNICWSSFCKFAKLIANDGEAEDQFGYSVFILGKTIAISSPNADGDLNEDQGCVYIFNGNEDGTIWNQTQKLFASDGQDYDQLGFSISISNDSNIMIIGAPYADVGNNEYQGKAYIFQNNGTYWNEIQILISSDGESWDEFGYSVFISSDSSWIIIGAPDANVGSNSEQGKAYIFQKNGNQWNETQILISSDGQEYDSFGWSSSISSDSSWLIIGSIYATDDSNEQQGKVYIFQKNGNQWDQVQSIIETNGFYYDQFGWSVLISDQFAIVGAPSSDSNDFEFIESGNVYVINNIPLPTSSSSSISKTTIIVCSTVIPVVVIIVGVILTIFLIKKRRKQNQEISKDYRELKDN
ncbi:hypothetical protein M0811_06425 [Anaeramoeba ignava]|uniref:Uncharacterized protein n=1 Tax=Anaeramoeba ignava TaxID=1746090 RepID=A0A9Q0LR64_ANAIG|nr:hypothetical protein M0811_06425 [Anaeramoeba ignava]